MKLRVAILDDYLGAALGAADWNSLTDRCTVDVFSKPFADEDEAAKALADFDILVCTRDRTPFPDSLFQRLKRVRFIVTAGRSNYRMDMDSACRHGIPVCGTRMQGYHITVEHVWALILASVKKIAIHDRALRRGEWQTDVTEELAGRTLGVFGLGRIGAEVARIGRAFGMEVIAWSHNLTVERCAEVGVRYVTADALFAEADILTIHAKLSERTHRFIGRRQFNSMKDGAYLINTARGPIINEEALVEALESRQIAGAALEVFDKEPLPVDHPLRRLENVILTPHVSFVTPENLMLVYGDAVQAIHDWLDDKPLMILNPAPSV